MLHFRWVSFLGIQRVCDNQDFAETEQLKAYSRVLETHLHFICSDNSWAKSTAAVDRCGFLGLVYTPWWWDVQGMLQSSFFPKKKEKENKKKEKCPCFYNLKMNLTRLKNYVTSMKCPYKNRRFLLKKIHFKKVKKDHVEEMIPLKKKTIKKTSNLYKVEYKIQDTAVSVKYTSRPQGALCTDIQFWSLETHSDEMTQGTAGGFESLFRSLFGNTDSWQVARSAQEIHQSRVSTTEYYRVLHTRQIQGPMGSPDTKYFPVHVEYNRIIKG